MSVSSRVLPTTSCSCFNVSGLVLRSLIYFKMILVQSKKRGSSFSLLHVAIQFSQKYLSFLHCVFWATL
jgi:hypothetical protein